MEKCCVGTVAQQKDMLLSNENTHFTIIVKIELNVTIVYPDH